MENKKIDDKYYFVSFFLRCGLALVFLYAAIAGFLNPLAWVGFVPNFIKALIPATTFLHIYGSFQVLLALWLLSNKKIYFAALLSALILFAIIIANIKDLEIVFRDIAIMFGALALAVLSYHRR